MENVIQFKLPEKSDPHGSGEAVCLAWVWKYPFSPAVGEELWRCNCGCELFYIIPDGHMCYGCGTKQVY